MEVIGKLCEEHFENSKQDIMHNQMEGASIVEKWKVDATPRDFPDSNYRVFRRKRKKSSIEEADPLLSMTEQIQLNKTKKNKTDILSDIVWEKTESQDHHISSKHNLEQYLECTGFQKSAGMPSEEVGSHVNLRTFPEDHSCKGRIVHDRSPIEIDSDTEEDAKTDVPVSSQTSNFHEKAPLDNYNSVCEICRVGGELLCCDGKDCPLTYHLSCLDPPLDQVPDGDWFCPTCVDKRTCISLSMPLIVESIWDEKESDIIMDSTCDDITSKDVSHQRKRNTDVSPASQRQNLIEAKHDSSMQTDRENGVSETSAIQIKSPADGSSFPLEAVDIDGYQVDSQREFKREKIVFVKYKGLSHVHNRWITESQIMKEAPKQLYTFRKKVEQGMALKWNPQWTEPDRLIQKRVFLHSKLHEKSNESLNLRVEWLVKWKGLGYDQCTWEMEGLEVLASASASELKQAFERRSIEAKDRDLPGRATKAKNLRDAAYLEMKEFPQWIRGGNSLCHRLKFINKLCKFWQTHQNAVIVDEVNQERISTVITFILLLTKMFEVVRPILLVASSATISSWEDELLRCDSSVNFIVYNGNRISRELIQKHEFYEKSGCLMVQIVLTTCDIVVSDLNFMKHLDWEAVILDEFQRLNSDKSLCHLKRLLADFRFVLFSEAPKDNSFEVSRLLSFLMTDKSSDIVDIQSQDENQGRKGERTHTMKKLEKYLIYENKSDNLSGVKLMEHWVPIGLTNVQMDQYCSMLIRNSDLLCLHSKKSDYVERLRDILLSLRKCCNHPYLVDPTLENKLIKRFPEQECLDVGINASGKLQLLDIVLSKIKLKARRLLILFQTLPSGSASIGDILDDHLRRRLGDGSYERIDAGLTPVKKQAALQRFNCKDSGRLVFLLEKRACGPHIKLSSIDTVLIFDTDWNPLTDLRALQKAHIDTKVKHLNIFRFYSPYTVEERLLITAKQDIELDNNLENINATVCQQLLRWGVVFLFQNYDKFRSSDSPLLGSQCLYSDEDLKILIEGMLGNRLDGPEFDSPVWNSLAPRVSRTHGYGKGILLFGESANQLAKEGKVPSNVFWINLLKARRIDPMQPTRRRQRFKNKVCYSERSSSKPVCESTDTGVKTKYRKLGSIIDPIKLSPWIKGALLSSKKEKDRNAIDRHPSTSYQSSQELIESEKYNCKDKDLFTDPQLGEHSNPPPGSSDVFEVIPGQNGETSSKMSFKEIPDSTCNRSFNVSKVSLRSKESLHLNVISDRPGFPTCTSSLEGSAYQNKESGNDSHLCRTHKSLHFRMKQEIVQLCNALRFPDEVARMAENFYFHVINNYQLPIQEISLAQALEISLCLAAADCSKHAMDIEASLELAQSQFHFQCSRKEVDSVYEKILQKLPSKKKKMSLTEAEFGDESPLLSSNSAIQKTREETCSKDERASNDDFTLIEVSSVQPLINLKTSTGLDVHQYEREDGINNLDTKRQQECPREKDGRNPVQEQVNCNPDRPISVFMKKDISLSNQHAIVDLESDKLLECQMNVSPAIYAKMVAEENIHAGEKDENMTGLVQRQQSELRKFIRCIDRNKEKHETVHHNMDNTRIGTNLNAENSFKFTEKEKVNSQQNGELDRHLSRVSENIENRQISIGEEENLRYDSIIQNTSAQPVQSQPSPQENLESARDTPHKQLIGIPRNRIGSPCRVSVALDIDQSLQGHEPNFLQEWELHRLSSNQQYQPLHPVEIRAQCQQASDFSISTDNLIPIQNRQCHHMHISESGNQSQHLQHSGHSQAEMLIGHSQPLRKINVVVGSNIAPETVAITDEQPTRSMPSGCSPSAPLSYHSMQIGSSASSTSAQPNFTDPLFHELLRIRKKNEQLKKRHEEESAQIKVMFQEEFEELKNKYDGILREKKLLFEQKNKFFDEIIVKVGLNQCLAEVFRVNIRRENDTTVSGYKTQLQQSHVHAMPQLSSPSTCSGVRTSADDMSTAARSVQANEMLASQVPGDSSRMQEGSIANPLGFGSIDDSNNPVFQTPADSINHVGAPPTNFNLSPTNSRHEVSISTLFHQFP